MFDSNLYYTIIGAGIGVVSSIVAGHYSLKNTKLHEEKTSERFMKELEAKIDLENIAFEHKIILSNREYIPNATKETLDAINQLYICTEKLVVSYPGTSYTGTHPGLMFRDLVSNKVAGFPSSMVEIFELSNNWIQAYENLDNTLSKNSIYLSEEICEDILKFVKCCMNIKDYFYGYYVGIESEEDLDRRKLKYEEQVRNLDFVREKGKNEPTYYMLSNYDNLKKLKLYLINKIRSYQIQKTEP